MASPVSFEIATTKATVSHAQRVIRDVLTAYLFSIRKPYPQQLEPTINLACDLWLPPGGEEMDRICAHLSDVLLCETPPLPMRLKWTGLMDLHLYYLARAHMAVASPTTVNAEDTLSAQ
jgi:hypothetical protein